jgi:hypothetical protein
MDFAMAVPSILVAVIAKEVLEKDLRWGEGGVVRGALVEEGLIFDDGRICRSLPREAVRLVGFEVAN